MISKDGEEVAFKTPVAVADNGVKEWLKGLETEMRSTLALLLREAVGASGNLTTSKEDAGVSVLEFVFCLWRFESDRRVAGECASVVIIVAPGFFSGC